MSVAILFTISAVSFAVAIVLTMKARRRVHAARLTTWALLGFAPIGGEPLPLPWSEQWTLQPSSIRGVLCSGKEHVHVRTVWWDTTIRFVRSGSDMVRAVRNRAYCREVRKSYYNRIQAKR